LCLNYYDAFLDAAALTAADCFCFGFLIGFVLDLTEADADTAG